MVAFWVALPWNQRQQVYLLPTLEQLLYYTVTTTKDCLVPVVFNIQGVIVGVACGTGRCTRVAVESLVVGVRSIEESSVEATRHNRTNQAPNRPVFRKE